MLVEITICERKSIDDQPSIIDEDILENWDTCKTMHRVFQTAKKEYGRWRSNIYIDKDDKQVHIGWLFEKREKYSDCQETYLQETWVVPLKSRKTKIVREYALGD